MPCTFSHPLAIVPLHRACPRYLNFAALVIGSFSPDFAYYVRQFDSAHYAHTIAGTFTVCLPSGLLALVLFYALRAPCCALLPMPHRSVLSDIASTHPKLTLRNVISACVSLLLGAWSHTIWDSFTHTTGWSVQHLAFLQTPVVQVGSTTLPASYALQHISTFVGAALLAVLYVRWLHRRLPAHAAPSDARDGWRYALLAALVVTALILGASSAYAMAIRYQGYTAFRVFVFRTGVYSAAAFAPMFILASLIAFTYQRRPPPATNS